MFVVGLLLIPVLVARMPADYFVRDRPPPDTWFGRHPAVRLAALVIKNTLGGILLITGIAMLILPGQGVLTILVALSLLNFPGKRSLQMWIVRRHAVRRTVDWIRRRAHRPPLQIPLSGGGVD